MIRSSPFEIHSELQDEAARLTLSGELDLATVPRVEEAVVTVLGQGVSRVLIDLRGLAFVDSSGLRMFISLNDRAAAEGWTLGLIRPSDPSVSVFRITGADQNLPFVEEPPKS